MAISRNNPAGWNLYDKFTSAMANAIDTALTFALDKRAGQTDTLQSIVSATGAGRVIPSSSTGADADTTYPIATCGEYVQGGTLTATRTYTFSNTGAVLGDMIQINAANFDITVKNAAATPLAIVGKTNTGIGQVSWAVIRFDGTNWQFSYAGSNGSSLGLLSALYAGRGLVTGN